MKRLITICAVIMMMAGMARAAFDNPNYTYTKILDVGDLFRTAESQFSPDGTKILWTEREVNSGKTANVAWAVKYGDWNPVTHTISNITTMDSSYDAGGNPVYISGAKWSPDGSCVGYMKYDPAWGATAATQLWRYNMSTSITAAYYTPATGKDMANPDFYGSNDMFVFWDIVSGAADLFTYDGTNLNQLTNTPTLKEYEPRVFGTDTSKVLYWSGETTGEPYDSIHILNSDASVTDVALGGHLRAQPVLACLGQGPVLRRSSRCRSGRGH